MQLKESSDNSPSSSVVEMDIVSTGSYNSTNSAVLDTVVLVTSDSTTVGIGTTPGGSELFSGNATVGSSLVIALHHYVNSGDTIYFKLGAGSANIKMFFDV